MNQKLLAVSEALSKNRINATVVNTKEDALKEVEKLLSEGASVACGGSVTLSECGVIDLLKSGKYNFIDRLEAGISQEESEKRMRDAFSADYYLASSNAVTENGELYNVDGKGNRVSALSFGPKKVILVVGKNKIVKDIDEAILRVKTVAAPKNCVRLGINSYCSNTGHCLSLTPDFKGCMTSHRICCDYTVTGYQREADRISVILVNEDLGY